jgi:hypothetical protein
MEYQCVQHNKIIEMLVDMEYRQLGKINKWVISTVGVYQQFGQIDSLGMATFRHINSLGVLTVSYCLFTNCKETIYSHSLSPDLSFDTHIDALLPFIKV